MVQNKKSITGGEYGTNTNIWRLNNMLLKTNELMKKSKRESSILSDHKAIRLDINYKKKNCKKHKHMEIKQHLSK